MKSNRGKIVFIIIILVLVFGGAFYKNYKVSSDKRIVIEKMNNIEVYYFTSFSKFSDKKITEIDNAEQLDDFKDLFNSLDSSDDIKKIEKNYNLNKKEYDFMYHIKPNFIYKNNGKDTEGDYLLYILKPKDEKTIYVLFSNTELGYVVNGESENKLESIFSEIKD